MLRKRLKDYFIPHEGNGFAPDSLQRVAMIGMLFLIVLSFTATNLLSFLWISSSWLVGSVLPAVIVELTNEERVDDSLGTLRRNTTLDLAARMKAEDMAKSEYFAHYSPDGVSPWKWFGDAGYNFVHAGENLAIHFTDSEDVVDAWMESPSHRANILNGNYTEIGVGTAKGTYEGFNTVYVVQLFGAPALLTPAVAGEEVSVASGAEEDVAQEPNVLSDSVSLSESIVFEEEPVAMVVEEVPVTVPKEIVNEDTTALYSDFISTSTGGIPATLEGQGQENSSASFLGEVATKPNKILEWTYIIIGSVIYISLLLSIFIEVRRQQPMQIAYGVGLLSLMLVLFYIQGVLTHGALVI